METSVSTRAAEDARRAVEKAQRDLDLAQERLERIENAEGATDSEQKLAEELHEVLCRWNHNDECTWLHEIKFEGIDWSGFAHAEYLKRSKALAAKFPSIAYETLSAIVVQSMRRV